ncbi:hypothetical protein ABZ543_16785 [Streptomyces roseifaciens]
MRRMAATGAASIALATAGLLATSGTAAAGSNGQQIHFKDTKRKVASIWIYGSNQNGQAVGLCWQTPDADTYVRGHWWKGIVDVRLFRNRHCDEANRGVITTLHPKIPKQQDGNFYKVTY